MIVAIAAFAKSVLNSRKTHAEVKEIKAHVDALEAQKQSLLADAVLKRVQAQQLEHQLRSLNEHRPEIEGCLDAIREHATNLYNEVIRVYDPFLPGAAKLTKAKLQENLRNVQRFAREQTDRPKIEEARSHLERFSSKDTDAEHLWDLCWLQ